MIGTSITLIIIIILLATYTVMVESIDDIQSNMSIFPIVERKSNVPFNKIGEKSSVAQGNKIQSAQMLGMQSESMQESNKQPNESAGVFGLNQNDLDDLIELQCDDLYDSDRKEVLFLKKPTHNISIEEKGDFKLIVTVEGRTNAYLVHYNSSFIYGSNQSIGEYLSCVDSPHLELHVEQNTTYTFCVLPTADSDEISPLNCLSYYVKPTVDDEIDPVWITNDERVMVYGIAFCFILLLIFLGFCIGTFLIRKNPQLFKLHKQIDHTTRFNNASTGSIFRVEDNSNIDYAPKPYRPPVLNASPLKDVNRRVSRYWDTKQKPPTPIPAIKKLIGNEKCDNKVEYNLSENNNKNLDKKIHLRGNILLEKDATNEQKIDGGH